MLVKSFLKEIDLEPSGEKPDRLALTDFELASRLSYFLWSSMPDDELFELAANGSVSGKHKIPEPTAKLIKLIVRAAER